MKPRMEKTTKPEKKLVPLLISARIMASLQGRKDKGRQLWKSDPTKRAFVVLIPQHKPYQAQLPSWCGAMELCSIWRSGIRGKCITQCYRILDTEIRHKHVLSCMRLGSNETAARYGGPFVMCIHPSLRKSLGWVAEGSESIEGVFTMEESRTRWKED